MVECAWAVFVDDFGGVSASRPVWVSVCGGCGGCVGHMGWSGVLPLRFPGGWGCSFCLFCFSLWLSFQEWGVTLGDGGHLGWCCAWGELQVFQSGRAINNRTLIYKGLTVTRFFGRPILGACGSPWMRCWFRQFFRFAFLRGYVFISNQGGKWWGWVLPFFVSYGVPVFARIGSFLLCFACLPWLPLRAGACVSGLVGVFLVLSVGAVRVHLIIWTSVWIRL